MIDFNIKTSTNFVEVFYFLLRHETWLGKNFHGVSDPYFRK